MNAEQESEAFSPEEVESALDRISASGVLGSKSRIRKLLRYIVEMEIGGQGERLKAFTIATKALGRSDDFDPGTDSIVRVEVNRLRQALQHYYDTRGAEDPLRIEIPKGSYRPEITAAEVNPPSGADQPPAAGLPAQLPASGPMVRFLSSRWFPAVASVTALAVVILLVKSGPEPGPDDDADPIPKVAAVSGQDSGQVPSQAPRQDPGDPANAATLDRTHQLDKNAITVAVLPFKNLTASERSAQLSSGLEKELRSALARNHALSLITNLPLGEGAVPEDLRRLGRDGEIAYFTTGAVQDLSSALRVGVELVDGKSGEVVWARTYHQEAMKPLAFRDSFVSAVTSDLRPQFYSATKRAIAAKNPEDLSAWELYLMATWAPGEAISTLAWEKERVELAKRAVALRPQFGQAHSVLADKLAYLAAVDPPSNSDAALESAQLHAQIASELAPSDADVLFNLSIHHWHIGKMEAATRAMARVLELDPNHVLARPLVKLFPYTCGAPPDEVVQYAIDYDAALAPDNPVRWVTLTWLSMLHLNRGELELALEAERRTHQIFQTPDTVLRMAALLNGLDRADDANALIAAQRRNWPNIDAGHFAEVTMPRRCHEAADAEKTLQLYRDLALSTLAD